jgi:hypothetical protein
MRCRASASKQAAYTIVAAVPRRTPTYSFTVPTTVALSFPAVDLRKRIRLVPHRLLLYPISSEAIMLVRCGEASALQLLCIVRGQLRRVDRDGQGDNLARGGVPAEASFSLPGLSTIIRFPSSGPAYSRCDVGFWQYR